MDESLYEDDISFDASDPYFAKELANMDEDFGQSPQSGTKSKKKGKKAKKQQEGTDEAKEDDTTRAKAELELLMMDEYTLPFRSHAIAVYWVYHKPMQGCKARQGV